MDIVEAKLRAKICGGYLQAKKSRKGGWFCENCGLQLIRSKRNKTGFRHYFDPGEQKACLGPCGKLQSIDEFYLSDGTIDGRASYCRTCSRNNERTTRQSLAARGKSRHVWLSNELYDMVMKVKGNMPFRDFVIIAVRKEVERRTHELTLKKTLEGIRNKKHNNAA
jgi:hypothetical protein